MPAHRRLAPLAFALALSGAAAPFDPVRSADLEAEAAAARPAAPRESVTIPADARGFFHVLAQVNGVPVRAVVDTGASAIYLGRVQAATLGIDLARGRRSEISTFRGPRTIRVVKLDRVQVGALVARDVDAWVVEEGDEGPPQPLLGMSFLQRFEVRVGGGAMTLTERARR
ncbi:MAG TPA: TIGR02281 family clan AA aspartic protease [Burkholderiales bacterium]|nr:TIGR02281 family clan AA aspartic protease [Burkholderiales bacterium]